MPYEFTAQAAALITGRCQTHNRALERDPEPHGLSILAGWRCRGAMEDPQIAALLAERNGLGPVDLLWSDWPKADQNRWLALCGEIERAGLRCRESWLFKVPVPREMAQVEPPPQGTGSGRA